MHRPPREHPPGSSGFPLQPDPGIPPAAFSSPQLGAQGQQQQRSSANGTTSNPSSFASDVSATADAVSSLALAKNNDDPTPNPPVSRGKRIMITSPLDSADLSNSNGNRDPAAPSNEGNDTVPLLVKDLDGSTRQVNVPSNVNTDDIMKRLLNDAGLLDANEYKLSFGETDIEPGVSLADTNVIPAYTHATSLLQVIGSGRLQPEKTAQALDSVCGVVRSLSNGITDIGTLCAAATNSLEDSESPLVHPSADPQAAAAAPSGRNELFQSLSARDNTLAAAEGSSNPWGESPTPAALVRNLSRLMPDHFAPGATGDYGNNNSFMGDFNMGISGFEDSVDMPTFDVNADQPDEAARDEKPSTQPRIADIAMIRRAKQAIAGARNGSGDALGETGPFSNLDVRNLGIEATVSAAAASGYGNGQAVVGRSGDATWMDDVKTTWEAGLVRSSGVLDRTPTGKDLGAQFKALDIEMKQENTDFVESGTSDHENSTASSATISAAGTHSAMDVDDSHSEHSRRPMQSSDPAAAAAQPTIPSVVPGHNSSQSAPVLPTQPVPSISPLHASVPISTSSPSSVGVTSPPAVASAQPPITRKPTFIAPSPPAQETPLGQPPQFPVMPPKSCIPLRRGRKPKHPHHTPEERQQRRKEQKRASARQARIRKKSMEDDYQQKVRTLLGENSSLRLQVADLSNRLECLQGLLTVSLRPVNQTGGGPPLFPPPATQVAPQGQTAPPFRFAVRPGQGSQQNGSRQNAAVMPQQANTQSNPPASLKHLPFR